MSNAFYTFKHFGILFLAIPMGTGFRIVSETSKDYGAWPTIKAFRDKSKDIDLDKLAIGTASITANRA